MNEKVVCFGEVLWDSLPKGIYLGGAPLNVALNMNNLGINTTMISAVGNDKMGKLAVNSVREKGLSTECIQFNKQPTGIVDVEIDEHGNADYTINEPSAWDYIEYTDELQAEIYSSSFVIFGTLIFRNLKSRSTLVKALSEYEGTAVVDVNFRKPFYDEDLLDNVLEVADIVKVNQEELDEILEWKGTRDISQKESLKYLADSFDLRMVLLTCGDQGSVLYHKGGIYRKGRFDIKVKDTVGTGDAFLAGAIYGLLNEYNMDRVISYANALGAFVASRNGATPKLDMDKIESILNSKSNVQNY